MGPTFVARLMLKKKINLSRKFNFGLCPCKAHINTAVGTILGMIFLYWERYFCTGDDIVVLGTIFLFWERYFYTGNNIFVMGMVILNCENDTFCTAINIFVLPLWDLPL